MSKDTRSCSDLRKELEAHFKSEFINAVNGVISKEMGGFLVSEEFKTMTLSTTTAVVSEVMSNTIESLVKKEIEASVQPLRDQISVLKSQVNKAKLHSKIMNNIQGDVT
jgi:hypothetical protein